MNPPDDANDLRGLYFKRLLSSRLTWALILGATIAAGVAAAIFVGAAVGGGAAARGLPDLAADRLRDRRLPRRRRLLPDLRPAARARTRRPRTAAADDAAAAQGRRPLRRAHPLRPLRRGGRRDPRSLYLRGRVARQRRQHRDQLLPLHGRPGPGSRVGRRWSPSSTASASPGCARWRSSRTSSAAPKSGSSWRARRSTRSTRSSPAKARTRTTCASSSPPPSSSG